MMGFKELTSYYDFTCRETQRTAAKAKGMERKKTQPQVDGCERELMRKYAGGSRVRMSGGGGGETKVQSVATSYAP